MNAHGTMDFAICAESNPLFSSNKFATYAKSKTNYKENLKLLAFILLAVIFAFFNGSILAFLRITNFMESG